MNVVVVVVYICWINTVNEISTLWVLHFLIVVVHLLNWCQAWRSLAICLGQEWTNLMSWVSDYEEGNSIRLTLDWDLMSSELQCEKSWESWYNIYSTVSFRGKYGMPDSINTILSALLMLLILHQTFKEQAYPREIAESNVSSFPICKKSNTAFASSSTPIPKIQK